MPLGNQNQNSSRNLLILKIKTKNAEDQKVSPHFQVSERDATTKKFVARVQTETRVAGNLTNIEFAEGEWEGQKYDIVKIYIEDNGENANELYLLDTRVNMLTRNLYNSLLNLDSFENLSVSLYESKSKKDGQIYPNISLWQGKDMIKGKFTQDQLPKVVKVTAGKKTVTDSSELDEFFLSRLKTLAKSLKGNKPAKANKEPVAAGANKDDVPF